MGGFGIRELVVILVVVLLIFGTKKMGDIGSDLGRAVRGFRQSMSEGEQDERTPPKQVAKDAGCPEAGKGKAEETKKDEKKDEKKAEETAA
jgi:sec-independent protein translocase protein TatA